MADDARDTPPTASNSAPEALCRAGVAAARRNDPDGAEAAAIALGADTGRIMGIVRAMRVTQGPAKARRLIRRVLRRVPENATLRLEAAALALAECDAAEVGDHCAAALIAAPEDQDVLVAAAEMLAASGSADVALEAMAEVSARRGSAADLIDQIRGAVLALLRSGRGDRAALHAMALAALHPAQALPEIAALSADLGLQPSDPPPVCTRPKQPEPAPPLAPLPTSDPAISPALTEVQALHDMLAQAAYAEAERHLCARLEGGAVDPALDDDTRRALGMLLLRAGVALSWRGFPNWVDDQRLERMQRWIDRVGPAALAADLAWDLVRLFHGLGRHDQALGILAAFLDRPPERPELWPDTLILLLTELLREGRLPPALRATPSLLARALDRAGLVAQATGAPEDARLAHALAAWLDPENIAARLNHGFSALAGGAVAQAGAAFADLGRAYGDVMRDVAWPAKGRAPWPRQNFGLGAAMAARLPAGRDWPRITVITPSFQQGNFIEETLLSVLGQEYPNLEYIVVDGASDDGTAAVLYRYRTRLDHLIIEPDRGQSDAINKGLARATGDLITWLNSDDMLAPGALFALAEAFLATDADLLFGMCLPHTAYRFELVNMPAVRQDTFTQAHLADLFGLWFRGHFFYQPEVVLSRRLLDRIGRRVDETLNFTMDYELWMRCARAGARIAPVHWPVAFFRQHAGQKTAALAACAFEQADLRDRFVPMGPDLVRRDQVRARLAAALGRPRPRIAIVSGRLGKIFSADVGPELTEAFAAFHEAGISAPEVELVAHPQALRGPPDLLIKLVHLQDDLSQISALRKAHPDLPLVGWFWDNHHHIFDNHPVAAALDVVLPGHDFAAAYLRNTFAVQGPSVPLCVTQWSMRQAAMAWQACATAPRDNRLYGGFVRYPFAEGRNRILRDLIDAGEAGVYFLDEDDLSRYFGLSQPDRFAQWCGHKVSICLPLERDLSQRLFDALLCGQVPIVAGDMADLDRVIPADLRARLPVITQRDTSVAALRDAHAAALAAFDKGGLRGAQRRHLFARRHHGMKARLATILRSLAAIAQGTVSPETPAPSPDPAPIGTAGMRWGHGR